MGKLRSIRVLLPRLIFSSLLIAGIGSVSADDPPNDVVSEAELIHLWDEAKIDSLLLVFSPFAASHPNHSVTLFIQAALERDGHKAARLYQKVIDRGGNDAVIPRAMVRLGQYYRTMGDHQEAYRWERRLEMEYPDFRSPQYQPRMTKQIDYPYTLQLGAFEHLENAQKLSKRAEEDGLISQIHQKVINGRTLYLVWAGQFSTESEAEQMGQRLHRERQFGYRVIAINPKK